MENNTDDSRQPLVKSDLRKVAEVLLRHQVEFMVIGGQAETLMGSPRVTVDVDLCYRHSPENCDRLALALKDLDASLRGVPPEVKAILDGRALRLGANFTLKTSIVDLDLLAWVEPIGDYDTLMRNADHYPVADLNVAAVNLDDLIRIKQHINRPKDRDSLYQLLAIKRVRSESPQR